MNGAKLKFQSPGQKIRESSLYLLPSIKDRGELSTGAWNELKQKVREGVTLYLSLQDCFLPDLEEVCGAVVAGCSGESGEIRCQFPDFELTLPRPVFRRMKSAGAEILAANQNGNPVFFRHHYGKGTVYTSALEMEENISSRPVLYRSNGWKCYQLLFAGKRRLFFSDIPHLIATDHYLNGNQAFTVLRNCSAEGAETICTLAEDWQIRGSYSDCPEVKLTGNSLYLPGNCGAVIEVSKRG